MAELQRGCGFWPEQPYPCQLEPLSEPFDHRTLTIWDCFINDWEGPWQEPGILSRLRREEPLFTSGDTISLPELPDDYRQLVPLVVEQFAEDEATCQKALQLLLSLPTLTRPVSFEVIGLGPQPEWDMEKSKELIGQSHRIEEAISGWTEPTTTVQFVAHRTDAPTLYRQLCAHYPNSAIVQGEHLYDDKDTIAARELNLDHGHAATLALGTLHCFPITAITRPDPDPLGVAIAAMEHLDKDEWALVQVLFQHASSPWADTARQAASDPYKPDKFLFADVSDRILTDKFSSPLFAVSIRLAAHTKSVFDHLLGWAEQFAAPPQEFVVIDELDITWPLDARCTYRPGILLNAAELAGIVHLPAPSVFSERLRRVPTRTKAAPAVPNDPGSVVLGDNVHRGTTRPAIIPADLRGRHCYIAGQSGTGKSTLLLHMILQDITAGAGVGVIDPHGDLVDDVLARIPQARIPDVVLFNPTDTDYPPAFNILQARDDRERERIATEMVTTIHRFFPDAWGPRLEYILANTLKILLRFHNATLADVRSMLTDDAFRSRHLAKVPDSDPSLDFWHNEFPEFPKGAVDPILNKLSPFLLNTTIRNIICQRQGKYDFDTIINTKKIFLANLSAGQLTEQVAGVLGTFIMSKIVSAAFRRTRQQRRPWYLYIDEFQQFMQLAIGFERILAEARKFQLVLAGMANQYVGQLSDTVRKAVFGNVGTLLTFRLGTEDARMLTHEFGAFTLEEIMALERGQAIARVGGTTKSFNLTTYPPPPRHDPAIADAIRTHCRQHYATPREQVEQTFARKHRPPPKPTPPPRHAMQTKYKRSREQQPQRPATPAQPPVPKTPPPTKQPEYLSPDRLDDDFV